MHSGYHEFVRLHIVRKPRDEFARTMNLAVSLSAVANFANADILSELAPLVLGPC